MKKLGFSEFLKYQQEAYTILDVRGNADFISGHIPGSINIPLDRNFAEIAKEILIPNLPTLVISYRGSEVVMMEELTRKSKIRVEGYLEGGFNTWVEHNQKQDVIISMSGEELELEYKHGNLFLIDIRESEEFDIQHVDNSVNFEPEVLINNYEALDDKITNCIYCLDGSISTSVISWLKFNGKHNLYHVAGGFETIKKLENIKLVATEKKFEQRNN